ncbi:twin-arginine translocation signal domain-containing protein [Halorussus aquaticus]|uniref:Twin-arginine translocation signal domain-containing protein n=1 Tax=Halorussus aquaticus TaxID=2953748 RepID=A0ABD5PYF8_9EURY|nr:twin-arginine translocation signal domain-containing protein [Halorussus aquaticus]
MSDENGVSRRNVLKTSGVAFGAGITTLATSGTVSASHNEWNEGDIVSTDGNRVPGWYSCDLNDLDKEIDGQPGEIVGGPCYNGSDKFWKVELSTLGDVRWFNQGLLTREREG